MKKLILALSFLVAASAFGETHKVVTISNENWSDSLLVKTRDAAGAVARVTDCPSFAGFPGNAGDKVELPNAGAAFVKYFSAGLCPQGGIRLVTLESTGSAEYQTIGHFKDAIGNVNEVAIPELKASLPTSASLARLMFDGIQNADGTSTFLAVFASSTSPLKIILFDGQNRFMGTEDLTATTPYTFYRLTTPLPVGRFTLEKVSAFCGPLCENTAEVWAVAFVGRDTGSPRVITPVLQTISALP